MKLREYETLYLVTSDFPTDKIDALNEKISIIIKNGGGHVLTLFNWGRRRLAYRVKKQQHGIYLYFNYLVPGNLVREIERALKLEDDVLKFITVKLADEVSLEARLQEKRELVPLSTIDEAPESA